MTPFPSPNFGARRGGVTPSLIVIHYTAMASCAEARARLCDPAVEVSAHWLISETGIAEALVPETARAWHAGRSSWRGREGCNDQSVGIELEGLEGLTFESTQYTALVRLCQDLRQRYPVADIAGHEHIAPGRKQDPGPRFDWAFLQQQLAWPDRCFPEATARW